MLSRRGRYRPPRFPVYRNLKGMWPDRMVVTFRRVDSYSGHETAFTSLEWDIIDPLDNVPDVAGNQEMAYFRRVAQGYAYGTVVAWRARIVFSTVPAGFWQDSVTGAPPEGAPNQMLGVRDIGTYVTESSTPPVLSQRIILNNPGCRTRWAVPSGSTTRYVMSWRAPRRANVRTNNIVDYRFSVSTTGVPTQPVASSADYNRPWGVLYHQSTHRDEAGPNVIDTAYRYVVYQYKTIELWDRREYDLVNSGT